MANEWIIMNGNVPEYRVTHIVGGADVNMKDTSGYSLLHQAIVRKDSDTAIFLLNQGANIDAK